MRDKDTYNREFQANADKQAEEADKKDRERAKQAADRAKALREKIESNYKTLVTDFLDDELEKAKKQVKERWDAFTSAATGDLATKTKLAQKTGEEIGDAFVNGILTKMARLQQDSEAKIAELQAEWDETQFKVNVKFPEDNLKQIREIMDIQKEAINSEVSALTEAKQALHDEMAKVYTDQGLDVDENAIAGSEQMRQIENAIKNATARQKQATLDGMKEIDSIYGKYYDKQIEEAERVAQIQADNDAMYFDKMVNNRRKALNGFTPEEEAESLNRSYQLAQENLERQKAIYKEMANNSEISAERRIEAEKKVNEITRQMQVNEVAHDRDIWEQKADAFNYYVDTVSNGIDRIGELFTSLADYYEADMEAQLKAGKITEAEADRQYENIKGMRIAEATINTIAGAIGAYLQAVAAYPPPAGEILGGISAAAVTAAGMAEIKKIKSTTRSGSGSASGGISATATPAYEPYRPTYYENATGASDTENLRNALMEQPIYCKISDIEKAESGRRVRISESSF